MEKDFLQVKRAQWIGDVFGEKQAFGCAKFTHPSLWYGVSLYTQQNIIQNSKAKALDAVGKDIAEANITKEKVDIAKVTMKEADRKVSTSAKGVITIPAAATSSPTKSNGKLIFMDSVLGGKQLHYSRTAGKQEFTYKFNVEKPGSYHLSAHVVTPSWRQKLTVQANGSEPKDKALPFTVGDWQDTEPVEITLKKGQNILKFSRNHAGMKGGSIRSFTLTPKS